MPNLKAILFTVLLIPVLQVAASPDPEAMAAKLLSTMGGDAWRGVRTVHNTAVNHHPAARCLGERGRHSPSRPTNRKGR
jgi:hypothetical protein